MPSSHLFTDRVGRMCFVLPMTLRDATPWQWPLPRAVYLSSSSITFVSPTFVEVMCRLWVAGLLMMFLLCLHVMDCTLPFHRIVYHPSLQVCCMELVLRPGKSLARPLSVPTTAAFVNVAYLVGGVVVATPNPFGLQGENSVCSFVKRWTMVVFPSFPPWWSRPAWHPRRGRSPHASARACSELPLMAEQRFPHRLMLGLRMKPDAHHRRAE